MAVRCTALAALLVAGSLVACGPQAATPSPTAPPVASPEGAGVTLELAPLETVTDASQLVAAEVEGGTYRAEGSYPRPGRWAVTVVATVQERTHRATFGADVSGSAAPATSP
jgi:hypothetical protein